MYGIIKTMYRIKAIEVFRAAGIPYKCKTNLKRIFITAILLLLIGGIVGYVYRNEPIYAKENLLLAIQTNLHLIFLFLVFSGIFISMNWIQYDEYNEIKFLLSLPIPPSQVYKYKVCTLGMECTLFIALILLPFCIDVATLMRIGAYITIAVSGLLLGIDIGAKILCFAQKSLRHVFACMIFVFACFLYGFIYTRYGWRVDNVFVLYLFGLLVSAIACDGIVRNFSGLYSELLYRKNKEKKTASVNVSSMTKNEITVFVIKDYISFSRNKGDLAKTALLLGCLLVSIRLGGGDVKIGYQYLLPYIGCNIWILDLAGQETYFYQINKLLKNGSTYDYYFKRLLSGFIVVIPASVVGGVTAEFLSKGYISVREQIQVICISVLIIFLSVGISLLCKKESASKYNAAFGVSVIGQLIYYIVGASYIFLFEIVLAGGETATILFGIMLGINIFINLWVLVKSRNG